MRLRSLIPLLALPFFLCFSCQERESGENGPTDDGDLVTVAYTESTTPLVNPERGF